MTSKANWDRHEKMIRELQKRLRRLVREAQEKGCHIDNMGHVMYWMYVQPPAEPWYLKLL